MNKKGCSQILDIVAGDQVPQYLDLAPNIMERIQKRKGIRMQHRTRFISAAVLVAIVLVVLFYTVPGIAAAIGRWFGYVPGVGLVREGQIRVLAGPVSVTRDGVTITVDQVVLDPEKTALVYSADGIPSAAWITQPEDKHCPYGAALLLPDGERLLASPNGIQAWGAGYQHRFNFPSLPADINEAKLVINCLFNTRPGTAPENWEIPLRFILASPDVTAFPVIEISTPTAPAATATPAQSVPESAAPAAATGTSPAPVPITLTLDRAVQMDDGYLIYATVNWQDTLYASVDVMNTTETLHLRDVNGQDMLYELRYDEHTGVFGDQRETVFAIKTAPVQTPGPLTLALDWVSVDLLVDESFVFDPGPDPKTGQTWTLNKVVKIGQYSLLVRSAVAELGGYSFEMSSGEKTPENLIVNASLGDLEHTVDSGGGGGGGGNPGDTFFSSFNYADGLPEGPITVTVGSIGVRHYQSLEAKWTPPAASPNLLPTQAAACLTTASW
ncbi:MAG: DUF4179 domain-containing protein [Chloroflexi bacterium]|nr:MAG: DUF4179 domain-containing protein [Chloroflexota bacterium]